MSDRIANIFNGVARKLDADYKTAAVNHRGASGATREEFLLDVLRKYMPRNVQLQGSCEIVDTDGNVSPQIDISIVDPSVAPFLETQAHSVIPVECLYATVEVKSDLTKDALLDSCESFAKIARMRKLAYYDVPGYEVRHGSGGRWETWPTLGIIFGYSGAEINNLLPELGAWAAHHPAMERPFLVGILGKGILFWTTPEEKIAVPPMSNTILNSNVIDGDGHILAHMVRIMHEAVAQASIPPFHLGSYLSGADFGLKDSKAGEMIYGDQPSHRPCPRCGQG